MRLSYLVALTAVCGLAAGGCASLGDQRGERAERGEAASGQFARIEPGSSQRGDVTAIAGEPVYLVPAYNVAVYEDDPKPSRLPFGCGLSYRFVCGAANDRPNFYVVKYDESDIVERAEAMVGDVSYSDVVEWADARGR